MITDTLTGAIARLEACRHVLGHAGALGPAELDELARAQQVGDDQTTILTAYWLACRRAADREWPDDTPRPATPEIHGVAGASIPVRRADGPVLVEHVTATGATTLTVCERGQGGAELMMRRAEGAAPIDPADPVRVTLAALTGTWAHTDRAGSRPQGIDPVDTLEHAGWPAWIRRLTADWLPIHSWFREAQHPPRPTVHSLARELAVPPEAVRRANRHDGGWVHDPAAVRAELGPVVERLEAAAAVERTLREGAPA